MNPTKRHLLVILAISVLILIAGCSDRDVTSLPLAKGNMDPLVFDDNYGADVYFQAFAQTHVTAVSMDSVYAYGGSAVDGARSLKVNVPPEGSALGGFSGGVLTSAGSRNLTEFNALTFYVRATYDDISLDVVGFVNDNTGESLFEASRSNIGLSPDWTFVVIPIPNPSRLISERGMLTFAEGLERVNPWDSESEPKHPSGYDIWFDEIRFDNLSNLELFRSFFRSSQKPYFIGSTVDVGDINTWYMIDDSPVTMGHSLHYFDFASTDPSIVSVDTGEILVVGEGEATITAMLGEMEVGGQVDVTGYRKPSESAPAPTHTAEDVISLFSDAYNDVPVDTWRADWGGVTTQFEDCEIAGNPTKMYSSLNYFAIDFQTMKIDASEMTHLHLDVYGPAGTDFKVEMLTFPPDLPKAKTDVLAMDATTTPAYVSGQWSSLDIPLEDFQLPEEGWDWAYLGQLVLSSGDSKLVLVDNLYLHK